jgi:hypothetical protein
VFGAFVLFVSFVVKALGLGPVARLGALGVLAANGFFDRVLLRAIGRCRA